MVNKIREGASLRTIADEHGVEFIKYNRGIAALSNALAAPRDPQVVPVIKIYWGDSGTGKTRKATNDFPDAYILTKPNKDGNVWWDNYNGQKTIIFDEFYGWIPYDLLLRVLDRYPLQVPIKGGFVQLLATTFIFTSNKE